MRQRVGVLTGMTIGRRRRVKRTTMERKTPLNLKLKKKMILLRHAAQH